MARGYPDFFGQSIFPKFGALTYVDLASGVVAPGNWATVVDVSTKGQIHSCLIAIQEIGGTSEAVSIKVTVDGLELFNWNVVALKNYALDKNRSWLAYLVLYDTETPLYGISLSDSITFEQSLKVEIAPDPIALSCVSTGYCAYYRVQ